MRNVREKEENLVSIDRFLFAGTLIPDPVNPHSFNRYAYVLNNPLKFVDPTGHCEHLSQQDVFEWHDSCLNWIENEYGVVIDSWLQTNIHLVWAIYKGLDIMQSEIGGALFKEIYGNLKFIYTGGTGAISGSATTFSILFQGSSLKVFDERIFLGIDNRMTNLVTTLLHELSHFIVNRSSKDRGSE